MTEIKETDIWVLYEQGVSYARMMNIYSDTDLNYRMYNGDQWKGLKVKGVEKVQLNFIKPIIRYKTGIILSNLYAIHYSSENFENKEFRKFADKVCKMLNKKAASIWEKDHMDHKLRIAVKDAAINDMGVIYVNYSDETKQPVNEVLRKNDIYFGNENDSNVQTQPYILIKKRLPVSTVQELAAYNDVSQNEIDYIVGDLDNTEESGESAKYEKDNMCTVVTKLWKEDGAVYFEQSTKHVVIKKKRRTNLKNYPISIILWEEKEGSARGEGEVRQLIPNQLEVNKTAMRRALTVKNTAFPFKVANVEKIENEKDLDKVGGVIKVKGSSTVDDVSKVFTFTQPAQMSADVEKLQNELISSTRELAGAGDIATGQINPESASGRAILAVQQASQQPLTEHLQYTKTFVEDLARIWLDMLITYNDSVELENEIENQQTGKKEAELISIPRDVLEKIQANVKVDITPKSAYDKYAQEQSLENLLTQGYLTPQRLPELKAYIDMLDDDSNMPKQRITAYIEKALAEQRKIAMLDAQAQIMQQNVNRFLNTDAPTQARQLMEAQMMQPSMMTSEM